MTVWMGAPGIASKYPDRSSEQDIFTYSAARGAELGLRTYGFYLSDGYSGRDYINQDWDGGGSSYLELVQKTFIADVLASADFDRYVIWCFAIGQADMQWRADPGMSPAHYADEYQQMYDLAKHLAETYPTKEFILKNWEGDWQIRGAGGVREWLKVPPMRFEQYVAYHSIRQKAVHDAMRDHDGNGNVRYAIEGNRVLDDYGPLVIPDVVKICEPDIIALSLYEATETNYGEGIDAMLAGVEAKIRRVVERCRLVYPDVPIMLGEFSWPQDYVGFTYRHPAVAALMQRVIDLCEELGIIGIMWWQLLDNEEQSPGVPFGFNCFARDGDSNEVGPRTAAGLKFSYLTAGSVDVSEANDRSVTLNSSAAVTLGNPPELQVAPNSREITIAFWAMVHNLTQEHYLFGKAQHEAGLFQIIMAVYTTGRVFNFVGNTSANASMDGLISANVWYHHALTISPTRVRQYVNGVRVTDGATPGSQVVGMDALLGGDRWTDSFDDGNIAFGSNGKIFQPTLWGVEFTTSEVAELYNSGTPIVPTSHSRASELLKWLFLPSAGTNVMVDAKNDFWGALIGGAGISTDVP